MSKENKEEIIATIYFYKGDVPQITVYATDTIIPKFYAGTCNGIPFLHVKYIFTSTGAVLREFRIAGAFTIVLVSGQKLYPEECDQKENDKNEKGKL